ncbi:sulfite oxidase heme-binding subunit YedZ [Oceanicella sp. SM1341]|uniref:sulfite oxidase heme-binding subunit YedZ n=1 Tax=Oceanicella sp. SM1341 TaxID=1548889 RepID=UPI000E4C907E|nr:protein-methionine-sulfoxide reductase heme-binding subunit MsrQ [Oceanicella sp. SM1341]
MDTPWTDRAGRFSWIRSIAFAGALAPALWIGWRALNADLGPRPLEEVIHFTGLWTIRFLLITLAITPLRRLGLPRLVIARRMLGLTAMFYVLAHLAIYAVDTGSLARTVSEIVQRWYLVVGFVALAGLVALGVTSTDSAIRRLGRNWQRLHRAVYLIAVLGLLHFFMQSKLDVTEPVLMAGLFVLMMAARGAQARGLSLASPLVWAGIGVVSGLATAGLEAGWYAVATNAPASAVLAANLQFDYSIRPAWYVLATGVALALWAGARRLRQGLLSPAG